MPCYSSLCFRSDEMKAVDDIGVKTVIAGSNERRGSKSFPEDIKVDKGSYKRLQIKYCFLVMNNFQGTSSMLKPNRLTAFKTS